MNIFSAILLLLSAVSLFLYFRSNDESMRCVFVIAFLVFFIWGIFAIGDPKEEAAPVLGREIPVQYEEPEEPEEDEYDWFDKDSPKVGYDSTPVSTTDSTFVVEYEQEEDW